MGTETFESFFTQLTSFSLVLAEELSLVTVDAEEVVVVFVWLALDDDTRSVLVVEKMKLFSFKAIKRKTLATIQAINRIISVSYTHLRAHET